MAKYDAAFWRRLLGRVEPTPLLGTLSRLVENQEQKVTLALTTNLAEHELLEELLEDSKPRGQSHLRLRQFDYLLRAPWRYPPLPWGSRFGRRHELGIFYGSLSLAALFAEAAYYRLVFVEGMKKPFDGRVISQFTVFDAVFRTDTGFDLSKPPFARHEVVLRHKANYEPCQELGAILREKGIQAISYLSARSMERELNVALFSPFALRSKKHRNPRHGLSEVHRDAVSFRLGDSLVHYTRDTFLQEGRLPMPA